jgi:curli production assembly/transport component CsgF
MKRLTKFTSVIISVCSITFYSLVSSASPITYKPTNPSFGGNPFGSSHFISLANEQKSFSSARSSIPRRDPLQDFSSTIQRSLLSRLSQDIADSILGDDAQDTGTYLIGDTEIFFERVGDNISIDVNDIASGNSTNILVPANVAQ